MMASSTALVARALLLLEPGASFNVIGDPVSEPEYLGQVRWKSEAIALPAWSAVADAVATLKKQDTRSEIHAERDRRLIALLGAAGLDEVHELELAGTREAVRLLRKGENQWTSEEAARAAELDRIDAAIDAIRSAATALANASVLPEDFRDDHHWPAAI